MDDKLREIAQRIARENHDSCLYHNYFKTFIPDFIRTEDILNEYTSMLGMCGCGSPELTLNVIYKILKTQNDYMNEKISYNEKEKAFYNLCKPDEKCANDYEGLTQFVLYVLDSCEFLEHGSCIWSAWLTDKGEDFMYVLEKYFEENGMYERKGINE